MSSPDFNLRTQNLLMRPINIEDAELLWPYVSNPDISRDMSWQAHRDISETKAFIDEAVKRWKLGSSVTWCMFTNEKFCGTFSVISILRTHRALTYDRGELAYWIGPEFQGKGLMLEAGSRIVQFAFEELKLHKLVVGHHLNNERSKNLIERLGFKFLCEEEEVFMKDNVWISCRFYHLLKKDFLRRPL
jgi:ribosomal-protein-alanine N-acetyltransferase